MTQPLHYARGAGPTLSVRRQLARWLFVLGAALLACSGTLLVVVWAIAWWQGEIPPNWGELDGNHGPWRYHTGLRTGLEWAMALPLVATPLFMLSALIKPTRRGVIGFGIAIGAFFALIFSHFWLID